MIEAVNSSLANASLARGPAEQASQARSFAANPDRVQEVPQASVSLAIHVDVNFDKAVLQFRDSETGDVLRQIPTETQLQAFQRAQAAASGVAASIEEADVTSSGTTDTDTSSGTGGDVTIQAEAAQAQSSSIVTPVDIEA